MALAGFQLLEHLAGEPGVGAVHHLAQPVFDTVAQHQRVQVGVDLHGHAQLHRLAAFDHFDGLAARVV